MPDPSTCRFIAATVEGRWVLLDQQRNMYTDASFKSTAHNVAEKWNEQGPPDYYETYAWKDA